MSHFEFHLFRIKFIRPKQLSLMHDTKSPSEIFKEALGERPDGEFRKDYMWHIGNVKEIDSRGGIFAIGRTTKTTVSQYDQDTGDFIEELFEESPYTLCLYDLNIGFVAIAKKSKLSPTTGGIAGKLKKLIDTAKVVQVNEIDVRIDPITDPDGFIQKLTSAYVIKRFTAHFTGPNPIDADELFQKPMAAYCKEVKGESGRVVTEGESLDQESVATVTKSVAATGNEASARIQENQGQGLKTIHLRGDPAKRTYPEEGFNEESALEGMRDEYRSIRGQ